MFLAVRSGTCTDPQLQCVYVTLWFLAGLWVSRLQEVAQVVLNGYSPLLANTNSVDVFTDISGKNKHERALAEDRSCSWQNPWVFLVSVLAIKTAFLTICIVVFLHGSYGQYKTLLQNATEWCCVPSISAEKKESWTCCPKGWKRFQGSCYYLSDDKMGWAESKQNCTGMGSHLVVINSEAEQEFLFNWAKGVFMNTYETKYYIVLTSYENGQWQWVDQTPYKKATTFWKPGEPNLLFAEKCAAIHIKGNTDSSTYSNWNNVLCFTSCYRICELTVKFV